MADESDAGIEMDEDEDDFFVSFVTSLFSFLLLFFFSCVSRIVVSRSVHFITPWRYRFFLTPSDASRCFLSGFRSVREKSEDDSIFSMEGQ